MRSNRDYARRTFEAVARDAPSHHAELVAALRALPGVYRVGDETFAVVVRDGAIAVDAELPAHSVLDVAIAPYDIVSLLDGSATMETLLEEERLQIRAGADALLDLAGLVSTTLRGALRLRALHELFEEYRAWVRA